MSREAHVRICERLGHLLPRSTRLLIGIPPQLSVSRAVQYLKGKSSHRLLSEFKQLKKRYWGQHLWARGYWVVTSGNVTDEVWKEYIENQKPPEPDDNFDVV
jgi:putative transposase